MLLFPPEHIDSRLFTSVFYGTPIALSVAAVVAVVSNHPRFAALFSRSGLGCGVHLATGWRDYLRIPRLPGTGHARAAVDSIASPTDTAGRVDTGMSRISMRGLRVRLGSRIRFRDSGLTAVIP